MNATNYQISNCFLSLFNSDNEVICEFNLAELHLSKNNESLLLSDEKTNNTYSCDKEFFVSIGVDIDTFIIYCLNSRATCKQISISSPVINYSETQMTSLDLTNSSVVSAGAKRVIVANVGNSHGSINGTKIDKQTIIVFDGYLIGDTYYALPEIVLDPLSSQFSVHIFS